MTTYAFMKSGKWVELSFTQPFEEDNVFTSFGEILKWSSQLRSSKGIRIVEETPTPSDKKEVSKSIQDSNGKPIFVYVYEDLPIEPQPVPAPIITYKGDVWRRVTEEQANQLDTEISKLGVRERNLWSDSLHLDHSDPFFLMLRDAMIEQWGTIETDRVLAASEG